MRKARLEYGIKNDDDAVNSKDIDPLIMKGKLENGGFEQYVGNLDDYKAAGGKYRTDIPDQKKNALYGIFFVLIVCLLIWLIRSLSG
tara:strand:+ start:271 stop:531 length:261 start_codon:yes stop_codon:yes gene_type:complete